jgi:hypothetical protein
MPPCRTGSGHLYQHGPMASCDTTCAQVRHKCDRNCDKRKRANRPLPGATTSGVSQPQQAGHNSLPTHFLTDLAIGAEPRERTLRPPLKCP